MDCGDREVGNSPAGLCGGDTVQVELPTIEWQRSELKDKNIFVIRKTGRYRSLLKKQNQGTKKTVPTTASALTEVPVSASIKSDGNDHVDGSGTLVFDCTSKPEHKGNRMNRREEECPKSPRGKRMDIATQGIASVPNREIARTRLARRSLEVLKNKLRKTKEKLHSRHRRVSSSVSEVAELKNIIADLKSRNLITGPAFVRLKEAVDHSLSVYENNNFCDDLTTDT